MIIRIYETKNIDLDTVERMLYQADRHENFHPNSFWILSSSDGEIGNFNQNENGLTKRYKELHVKWIGRDSVVKWLLCNQVIFEIITHDLLDEEREALGELEQESNMNPGQALLN